MILAQNWPKTGKSSWHCSFKSNFVHGQNDSRFRDWVPYWGNQSNSMLQEQSERRSKSHRKRTKVEGIYPITSKKNQKLSDVNSYAQLLNSCIYHGKSVILSRLSSLELLAEHSAEASVLLECFVAAICTFWGFHCIQTTKPTRLDSYANSTFDVINKSRPKMMCGCSMCFQQLVTQEILEQWHWNFLYSVY